jgi:H/ACA ribonucleoprotein complex subunit 4
VTGVLPVTLEESTKVVQALLHSGKEYVCVMKTHGDVPESRLRKTITEFEDKIFQRPPLRASVKRQLRTRRIYYLEFLEIAGRNALFKVGCEGGTYIRKLCYDIGEVLGCGAHMQELRRTRSGPFVEEDAVRLHDLAYWYAESKKEGEDEITVKRFIQPMENALNHIPKIFIRDSAVDAICHGASLTAPGILSLESGIIEGSMVAVFTLKSEAVSLGKASVSSDRMLGMGHGTVVQTKRVIMPVGTYPKMWKSSEKNNR